MAPPTPQTPSSTAIHDVSWQALIVCKRAEGGILRRHTRRQLALIIAALLVIIGCSAGVAAQINGGRPRSGQAIYDEYCFRCHGLTGHGDGPEAKDQIVPPANFLSTRSRAKSEIELFTIISYGIAFSPMHGWRDRLSEEEIFEVIAYIRQLAPFTPSF